jgi:protein-S-isoprenylcysteine O-methyltransferase Ste14
MTLAIFCLALLALTVLNALLLLTAFSKALKLWPTPHKGSWQSYVFWPLFRGGLGLTILLGVWRFLVSPARGWTAYIGAPLALIGFGFTIYGYFALGIQKTYGADEGLVTSGLYRYSRNPQYVASILAFAGLALAAGSITVIILCALAAGVYVLLPYTEEPWLARAYGRRYEAYKMNTPRFLSLSKLFERPITIER